MTTFVCCYLALSVGIALGYWARHEVIIAPLDEER